MNDLGKFGRIAFKLVKHGYFKCLSFQPSRMNDLGKVGRLETADIKKPPRLRA
jgi:hypothetical protein